MAFVDELLTRHRQLTEEVNRQTAKAQDLMARVAKMKGALDALEQLIRHEGGEVPQGATAVVVFPKRRAGTPITEAAYAILEVRGEPMYYQDLAREVQRRDVLIGGQNPANTMLAHLSRDDRFYRPGRGTYALREWDPKARSVGVRRKKGA
jgi:hypothetical protein